MYIFVLIYIYKVLLLKNCNIICPPNPQVLRLQKWRAVHTCTQLQYMSAKSRRIIKSTIPQWVNTHYQYYHHQSISHPSTSLSRPVVSLSGQAFCTDDKLIIRRRGPRSAYWCPSCWCLPGQVLLAEWCVHHVRSAFSSLQTVDSHMLWKYCFMCCFIELCKFIQMVMFCCYIHYISDSEHIML